MSGKVGAIFRPPAEKLHLPRLTMNGRSDLMGVPKNRASMGGKVAAICRPPAEIAPPVFYDEWAFPKKRASKLNDTKRKQTKPNESKRKQTETNENKRN